MLRLATSLAVLSLLGAGDKAEAAAGLDGTRAAKVEETPSAQAESSSSPPTDTPLPTDSSEPSNKATRPAMETRTHRYITEEKTLALPSHIDALSLTVSGGVSLGAYEAGQLYMLTEALRLSPGSAKLMIAAGTSAGSANALIAAADACESRSFAPEESLGYRLWVPVGLGELFSSEEVTQESIFRIQALNSRLDVVLQKIGRELPPGCNFVASVAATRTEALDVELSDGLVVPRQSERFTFHVESREGTSPRITNYLDRSRNFDRPLLPLSDGNPKNLSEDLDSIRRALLASAAFPIAFKPVSVPHCLTERLRPGETVEQLASAPPLCRRPTRKDLFVDGGVFDNNPLGISLRLSRNGAYLDGSTGKPALRPVPVGGPEKPLEVLHVFVDPDLRRYPVGAQETNGVHDDDPLLPLLGKIGIQVFSSMRGQELTSQAERNIGALGRLWLVRSSSPPISDLLGAFFGFFEQDFRDFDYHLGTYDTFSELRSKVGTALGTDPFIGSLTESLRDRPETIDFSRRKLACIAAFSEPERFGKLARYCSGRELRNFRILLQVSLDRLWSTCRSETMTKSEQSRHVLCGAAHRGAPSPVVDPEFRVRGPRYKQQDESDFSYTLRLLSDYGFEFRQLDVADASERGLRLAVRRKLDEMLTALANAQDGTTARTVVLTAGRLAVNALDYEPPRRRFYVQLGSSLALGYLGRLGSTSRFFWNPDLRATGIDGLWTERPYTFAGTASLGLEFLLPFSDYLLQTSVGVRGGYQATGNDDAGFKECSEASVFTDPRRCSQFVIHTPVNATVLERVRLSVTPHFYPIAEPFGQRVFDLELGIGAELF